MTLTVRNEAEIEFSESVVHYESREAGLGARFRRVNLKVFSHYIAYVIRGDVIWVAAIAHAHQRPEFWRRRL